MKKRTAPDVETLVLIELRIPTAEILERTLGWRRELAPLLSEGRATDRYCRELNVREKAYLGEYGIETYSYQHGGPARGWFTGQLNNGKITGVWGDTPEEAAISMTFWRESAVRWMIRDNSGGDSSLINFLGLDPHPVVDHPIDLLPASVDVGGLW